MGKSRIAVFVKGPYDGWVKEFWDEGQKDVRFGEPGRYNDLYQRSQKTTRDGKVQFVWNATLSKELWRQWALDNGLPIEILEQNNAMQTVDGTDVDERPRVRVDVRHNAKAKRWELWLAGECEAVIDEREINSADDAANWIRDLGIAR